MYENLPRTGIAIGVAGASLSTTLLVLTIMVLAGIALVRYTGERA